MQNKKEGKTNATLIDNSLEEVENSHQVVSLCFLHYFSKIPNLLSKV